MPRKKPAPPPAPPAAVLDQQQPIDRKAVLVKFPEDVVVDLDAMISRAGGGLSRMDAIIRAVEHYLEVNELSPRFKADSRSTMIRIDRLPPSIRPRSVVHVDGLSIGPPTVAPGSRLKQPKAKRP